jgi:tetratricopeptide (TPR) repeat protein
MGETFFWQRWNKVYRYFYLFLLVAFSLSVIFFITGWYLGLDAVIKWSTISKLETLDNPIDTFVQNLLNYSVDVNTFLIKEQYDATGIIINPVSSYIYLALVLIAFIYILTLITYLDIFWFGIGLASFLFFLATLKTELLQLTGREDKIFLVSAIFTFLGLSYYFHSYRKETEFWQRYLSFAGLILIAGSIIKIFSPVAYPMLFLANFSVPVPVIITLIFMMTAGFENVFGFLYLITSGKSSNPRSRITNFLVITGLYLVNLLLVLIRKMGYIDWDILYISPFFIFLISAVYGIWSYRQRNLKSDFVPFNPFGAFLYLAMGTISFATIGLAFITGNDPMTEMFEYLILYSHLAYGFTFAMYLLINFGDLFSKNIMIYKVAYEWKRMPFFIMQGVSMVIMLSLFFYSNRFAFFLGASGYFNLGGDVYAIQKNYLLANEYYKQGFAYAYQNHRSNYSLASVALAEDKKNTATQFLTNALVRNPSEQAFVLLSNLYDDAGMYFPAVFTLKDALKHFEESPYINNNLGILYSRRNSTDSTYYFLNKASENSPEDPVPAANMLAFLTLKKLVKEADSLAAAQPFDNDPAFQNNLLIIKTSLNEEYKKPFISEYYGDSVVDGSEFPYLYNFGLKKLREKDNQIFSLTDSLCIKPENSTYKDHLALVSSLRKWYTGDKAEAIAQLDQLNIYEGTSAYFHKITGMLLFKQKAYIQAVRHLEEAHRDIDQEAMLYLAVTYLELNQKEKALPLLQKVSQSEFADLKLAAANLLMIAQAPYQSVENWDNALRYQYFHFRRFELTEIQKTDLINALDNHNIKTLAISELINEHLNNGQIGKARELADATGAPDNASDNYFAGEYNLMRLRLLEKEENWQELSRALKDIQLNDYAASLKVYFEARLNEKNSRMKEADLNYKKALEQNPFTEDVYLWSSRFYNRQNQKDQAYNILVKGIELLPASSTLYKEYIKMAYVLNLNSFAEDAMKKLEILISPAEIKAYRNEIKPFTEANRGL